MELPSWISSIFAGVDVYCSPCRMSLVFADLTGIAIRQIKSAVGPKSFLYFECLCPNCGEVSTCAVFETDIVEFAHSIAATTRPATNQDARQDRAWQSRYVVRPSIRLGCPDMPISTRDVQDAIELLGRVEFHPAAQSWKEFLAGIERGPDLPF